MTRAPTRAALEILLVDDSPTDRLIAIEALQNARVVNAPNVVENGVEAMAYLRRQGKFAAARRPDLILLDLNLPKKDGRAVLREIKRDPELKYIPVIVLTTSSADEDVARAYGDHANSYITKPVDFPRFAQAIEAIGSYWLEVVALPSEVTVARLAQGHAQRRSLRTEGRAQQRIGVVLLADDPLVLRQVRDLSFESGSVRVELEQLGTLEHLADRLARSRADVLVVDLAVEGSEGLEAYRRARAAAPNAALIALVRGEEAGELALREGAEDFLSVGELSRPLLLRALRYATSKQRTQAALRRAQRLEAMGEVASGVAHDFNNLVTVLQGHAELLSELSTDAPIRESVQGIEDVSERAAQLTRQLLAFSERHAAELAPIDLNRLVNDYSRTLRRVLGSAVRLELRLSPQPPIALADVGMLEQALLELAVRARNALPDGGELVVETGSAALEEASLGHPDAYAGAFATLTIRDSGSGLVPREENPGDGLDVDPLFAPQGGDDPRGHGLSLVRGLVQQQRGWLQLESEPGAGRRCQMFLPWAPLRPTDTAHIERAKALRGTENILLVDDESPVRQMAKVILARQGYQVLEARSGPDAITCFEESTRRVDLLLTDMVMPGGMTGQALAEELLRRAPGLKVIFTSGYGMDLAAPGFLPSEGVVFLPKPYLGSRLLVAVRRALDGAPEPVQPEP